MFTDIWDYLVFRFFLCSSRLIFSAFAKSMYFFLCSRVIWVHNFPAARAITVTCSLGFLLRNRRKKMMNGLVARHFIISFPLERCSELVTTFLFLPERSSTLPKGKHTKVRFHVSLILSWTRGSQNESQIVLPVATFSFPFFSCFRWLHGSSVSHSISNSCYVLLENSCHMLHHCVTYLTIFCKNFF